MCDRDRQTTILLVDDDQDNLDLMSCQVSLLVPGNVLTASNGEAAISLAKQFQPDLILLDIMLPDMDGLQIVRVLKQELLTKHIPVIAVSAMARTQDKETALQAGYQDYLTKPYELESLEALLHRYLKLICHLSN